MLKFSTVRFLLSHAREPGCVLYHRQSSLLLVLHLLHVCQAFHLNRLIAVHRSLILCGAHRRMHRLIYAVDARLQIGNPCFLILDPRLPVLAGAFFGQQPLIRVLVRVLSANCFTPDTVVIGSEDSGMFDGAEGIS